MLPVLFFSALASSHASSVPATVTIDPAKILKRFVPQTAFGAGVDGLQHGDIGRAYKPHNFAEMKAMGLRSLTYRLRTELAVEAWHWNPQGTWSDPARHQGYWLSQPNPGKPISLSWGYKLPRRGSTFDQANNDGYSRLDDGQPGTFWKSNPYLDPHFTHEPESSHPQWVLVDFGDKVPLDTLKIDWATPYAVKLHVEYWNGKPRVDEVDPPDGEWTCFPWTASITGRPGLQSITLAPKPVAAQYVRIWLDRSSHTAPTGSRDLRDTLGFAIREIYMGQRDKRGRFHDAIVHRKDSKQTEMIVSSTDPWHRSTDRDIDVEQPGFDRVEKSGLTNGLPMLVPAPVLFGVPEDAVNELTWFKKRGYPIRAVEMGEEPDGQMTFGQDYACLYLQVADQIRKRFPNVKLGGPCFQTTQHEFRDWPDPHGTPWLIRFLGYLHQKRRTRELGFFSFEWYPFDDVTANPQPQLLAHEQIFSATIRRLMSQGLTHDIPWFITEYGYSAFAGPSEVEMPGALLNADIVGEFLTFGGDTSFLYGYEPQQVIREHQNAWGHLMALEADDDGNAIYRVPTFYSAWLLTHAWSGDQKAQHALCKTDLDTPSIGLLGAYACRRPDGKIAVMLVNRSETRTISATMKIVDREVASGICYQYGPSQYAWKPSKDNGRPTRSLPPIRRDRRDVRRIQLPPWTLTVVVLDGNPKH
jgi:hypothetical protein